MSGEALYERYKDALRRGHVASLRGRLEEALTAYAEAAAIAPERATPHTSAGTALMRRKRPADAVRHYTAAVRLSPRDEAALLGRAQALAATDRRPQAADAYDAAADVLASNGKLADAVDASRRGLELAEGRERRRTLEQLIDRLRATEPAEPGRVALEKALVVLEGQAVAPRKPAAPIEPAAPVEPAPPVVPMAPVEPAEAAPNTVIALPPPAVEPEAPSRVAEPVAEEVEAPVVTDAEPPVETIEAPVGTDSQWPVEDARPTEPVPVFRPALDRDLPADLDLVQLSRSAEDTLERRVQGVGLDQLLDLATAYRRHGHRDAALDTCYLALSIAPDDVTLHLALVELYDERGWGTLATEKLDLLDRLATLDGDPTQQARVAGARAARA